jgi:simple sugar transport system permease protein
MVGLGVTLAFRAGLFNIGGQSQFLMGTLACAWVGFGFPWLPDPIRLILAIVAGAIGGAALGFIPGWLKVKTGAHEVITTLMLNNIMVLFVAWILLTPWFQRVGQQDALSKVVTVRLPLLLGPDYRVHAGLILALLTAAIFWFVMSRTTWGYQIRTVGANRQAAAFAGINVGATFIGVFTVAGALAGIAGAFEVVGVQGAVFPGIAANYGFDAIAIALLARQHPAGVIVAALLFGTLQAGAIGMQAQTGVSVEIVQVVQGLVIIFVAAPLFVRAVFRLKVEESAAPQSLSAGWGQ